MDVLGIDFGGSGIKGATIDLRSGELTAERHRIPTPQPSTPEAVAETVGEIVAHFDWRGPVGVGAPAVVQNGVFRTAANISEEWIGVDAAALFSSATGCPTVVVNDADAAGYAEMEWGAGRGRSGLVFMVTLGTGIGSALFIDGRLVPNTELGHLEVNGEEAEHLAADSARKREDLSWKKWAERLDEYLHHLQRYFWPDLFIVGGGVSKKHEKFVPLLTVPTPVVPAELRNEAGIAGAALACDRKPING